MYYQAQRVGAVGHELRAAIAEKLDVYHDRKSRLLRYHFSDPERAAKTGAAILSFGGTAIATAASGPSVWLMVGTGLSGTSLLVGGVIFVINGKEDLEKT